MLNLVRRVVRRIMVAVAERALMNPRISGAIVPRLVQKKHVMKQLKIVLGSADPQWQKALRQLVPSPGFVSLLAEDRPLIDRLVNRHFTVDDSTDSRSRRLAYLYRQLLGRSNGTTDPAILKQTRDFARNSSYRLPTYLVSFPRSGSNFLQSVLSASSGMFCCSQYGRLELHAESFLSLKSHAISPQVLREEILLFRPTDVIWPEKIVVITRDPRDVMISFYEYVKSKRAVEIFQGKFLHGVDYRWAAFGNPADPICHLLTFPRNTVVQPLSICDAFRYFTKHWCASSDSDSAVLRVRFEDLALRPRQTFQQVFDFLDLDCELAEEAIDRKVSLHSTEKRERGKTDGWRQNTSRYGVLLDGVNEALSDEIKMLGYREELGNSETKKSA